MANFAKVEDGVVTQVIVAEQDIVDSGIFGTGFVQTSYNTRGGVHLDNNGKPDGGVALRKNLAGIGYTYDAGRDAFIPPKPFPSWKLVEETCQWTEPIAKPTDGKRYIWDEATVSWVAS